MSQVVSGSRAGSTGSERARRLSSRFGKIAVENGLATESDVRRCLAVQKQIVDSGREPPKLGDIMVEQGYVSGEMAKKIYKLQGRAGGHREIDGYVIGELLGKGATGSVYKAVMKSMNRTVAIKILHPELSKDRDYVLRFLREARAAAWLNHQNIVGGVDVGQSNGIFYFVMDYVEGPTVEELVASRGPLPEKQALEIALMMARALEHAHRHGIIHRDIKPDNIVIMPDGTALLLDLGIARRQRKCGDSMIVGTPEYISPEQIRCDGDLDSRTDIYSLGVTLYQMLTGHRPFGGKMLELIRHHLHSVPVAPTHHVPGLSKETSDLVMEMMAKDREDRPADPRDLAIGIERALTAKPCEVSGFGELDADYRGDCRPITQIPLVVPLPDRMTAPPSKPKPVLQKIITHAPVSGRGGRSGRVGNGGRGRRPMRRRQ